MHLLRVPYVATSFDGPHTIGRGKHRSWCGRCNQLKPRDLFYWVVMSPTSETGICYYGPNGEWMCEDCRNKVPSMTDAEYKAIVDEVFDVIAKREGAQP